jgi:hypothetical protein
MDTDTIKSWYTDRYSATIARVSALRDEACALERGVPELWEVVKTAETADSAGIDPLDGLEQQYGKPTQGKAAARCRACTPRPGARGAGWPAEVVLAAVSPVPRGATEIAATLGTERVCIVRALKQLVDSKQVTMTGVRRGAKYSIATQ